MNPGDIDTILRKLEQQDAEQRDHRRDLAEIKEDVKEIKVEVKRTNGRVSELEQDKKILAAVQAERDRLGSLAEKARERKLLWVTRLYGAAAGAAATAVVLGVLKAVGVA